MGFVRKITGQDAAKRSQQAAIESGEIQRAAAGEASALLDPFQQLGQSGLQQSGFLTDPQAQFDFLQTNPLFQQALAQNQQATQQAQGDLFKSAAARGRLSAGDTLQQVQNLGDISSRNLLLQSAPLIQQQKASIGDLLTIGQNVAGNQGNLLTGGAAAQAAGLVGGANARNQGDANLGNLFGTVAGGVLGGPVGTALGNKVAGFIR